MVSKRTSNLAVVDPVRIVKSLLGNFMLKLGFKDLKELTSNYVACRLVRSNY